MTDIPAIRTPADLCAALKARAFRKLSPQETWDQRVSWLMGQLGERTPPITREEAEQVISNEYGPRPGTIPTDRPIIFSGPMVRALIGGRKTQTRRLATSPLAKCRLGDRLWVRESFAFVGGGDPGIFLGAATWREDARKAGCENIPDKPPRWKPSIHMPRWASRITLIVTDVRVQRLQHISGDDAQAEGAYEQQRVGDDIHPTWTMTGEGRRHETPESAFAALWKELHGQESWDDNHEVAAISFTVHRENIDTQRWADE